MEMVQSGNDEKVPGGQEEYKSIGVGDQEVVVIVHELDVDHGWQEANARLMGSVGNMELDLMGVGSVFLALMGAGDSVGRGVGDGSGQHICLKYLVKYLLNLLK